MKTVFHRGPCAPERSDRADIARPPFSARRAGRPVFEALERRRLLSADPAGALLPCADAFDAAAIAVDASHERSLAEVASNSLTTGHEIIFVDPAVDDAEHLINQLTANLDSGRRFEVVRLDGARDGITQVAETLAGRSQIDALHFVTHGGDGWLQLGATRVDEQSMRDHAATIARWGDALKANADVFLYGCDVAADSAGRALVETLARLARTDVAASTDDTGLAALGGDWDLEYRYGDVDTDRVLADHMRGWSGLLAVNVVQEYAPPFSHLDDSSFKIRSDKPWGQAYRVTSGPPTYVVNAVEVVLSRAADAPAQTITLSIRNFLDWNGAPLASASIQASDLATFERWQRFDLGSLTLNRDQIYYIRIDSSESFTEKVYLGVDSSRPFDLDNNLVDKNGSYVFYHDAAYRLLETQVTAEVPSATNLDTPETYTEDGGPVALTDIVVSDADSADVTATLSLSDPAAGTLSTGTSGSVTSTFSSGVWTASGAIADVNALLASVTFIPSANYDATFGIATHVSDGTSSVSGTKTMTGISVNDAPSLSAAPVTPIAEGTNTSGGATVTTLTTADPDAGDTFTYSLDVGLDASRFTVLGNQLVFDGGVLDFEAKPAYSVVVRSSDAGGLSSTTLVSVPVVDVNEPPAVSFANVIAPLAESASTASAIRVADVIVADDALGTRALYLAGADAALFELSGGWLVLRAGAVLDFETNPVLDVAVTVDDPAVGTSPDSVAALSLAIGDVNEPPSGAVSITGAPVEDGTLTANTSGIVDPEGIGPFIYRWQRSPNGVAWSTIPGATAAALVLGDVDVGQRVRLEVRYLDGQGDVKTLTSAALGPVANVNDAPVGAPESYTTSEDVALDVPAVSGVLINDTDIESSPLTPVLVSGPAHGSLQLDADGAFRYVPHADFAGTDGFVYRASDGAAVSADVAVTIDVARVNDAPIAQPDDYTLREDEPLTVTGSGLLANDSDVDGDALEVTLLSGPRHGAVALATDGTFTYVPEADFAGDDAFAYAVRDASGGVANAQVRLTVAAVADAPLALAGQVSTAAPAAYVFALGDFPSSDADGDAVAKVRVLSLPSQGELQLDGRRIAAGTEIDAGAIAAARLQYLPPPAQGTTIVEQFDFAVGDGVLWSGAASMSIGVAQLVPTPVPTPVPAPVPTPSPAPVVAPVAAPPAAPLSATVSLPIAAPSAPAVDAAAPQGPVTPSPAADPAASANASTSLSAPSAASAPASGGVRSKPASAAQPQVPVSPDAAANAPAPTSASDPSIASADGAVAQKPAATAMADLALAAPTPDWRPGTAVGAPRVGDGSAHTTDAGGEAAAGAIKGAVFRQELDRIRADAEERISAQRLATGTVMIASSAISVGYVLWLLRGGILLSSLLSSLPAWRFIDPLPVLARFSAREDEEDDDSLEDLVAQGRGREHRDAPAQAPSAAAHDETGAHVNEQERT